MTRDTSTVGGRSRPLTDRTDPLFAEFRRSMSQLQEIATLPLDVVDDAAPSRLRCRPMEINPGRRAMKRVRSLLNDRTSACFPARARFLLDRSVTPQILSLGRV